MAFTVVLVTNFVVVIAAWRSHKPPAVEAVDRAPALSLDPVKADAAAAGAGAGSLSPSADAEVIAE